MKRGLFLVLSVLLIAGLFVSCNSEPAPSGSGVAKVALRESKALIADTSVTVLPDIDDLYVFYTARKTSDGFRTGETSVPTPIRTDNDGKGLPLVIGQTRATFGSNGIVTESDTWFSTGTWEFCFYATTTPEYNQEKIVFQAVDAEVVITRPSESENIGGYAEIALEIVNDPRGDADVYVDGVYVDFGYSFDSSASYKLSVTIDNEETPIATAVGTNGNNGRVLFSIIGPVKSFKEGSFGNHTLHFEVTKENEPSTAYASGNITIPAQKGYSTVIRGDLESLEAVAMVAINLDLSTDVINGSISSNTPVEIIGESTDVVVTSDVAPDMTNDGNKTTVTFASTEFSSDSNVSYNLNVEVTTAAIGENSGAFEVISTTDSYVESSIAEIDLTLVKTTTTTIDNNTTISSEPVTNFNSSVTIETYVEPGLDGIKVYYKNGDTLEEMSVLSYDSLTGKVSFTTNHFSKYIVSTNSGLNVMNNDTGKKYKSLQVAVNEAKDGERIVLLGNIELTNTVTVSKGIILYLDGHTVTATNTRALWMTDGVSTITGGGTIKTEGSAFGSSSSVIRIGSGSEQSGSAGLIIDNNVTVSSDYCYGVTIFGKNTEGQSLEVKGTVSATGTVPAISGNGSAGFTNTQITVREGACVSATQNAAIYHPQAGVLTITGGTITGASGIEAKGGSVTISGGTITATVEEANSSSNNDGTSTRGYAVVSVENSGYKGDASIEITGGTVYGTIGVVKDSEAVAFDAKLAVKGGLFSLNPENYVVTGYCVGHDNLYDVAAHTPGTAHGTPIAGIDGYKHYLNCDHCGHATETEDNCVSNQGYCAVCEQEMIATITFDGNGATAGSMDTQTVHYGVSTGLSANSFANGGLVFAGWNTKADGKGVSYNDKASVTFDTDTTLYAMWVKGNVTKALTFEFKSGGKITVRKPTGSTTLKYTISNGDSEPVLKDPQSGSETEDNPQFKEQYGYYILYIPVQAGDKISFYANGTGSTTNNSFMYIHTDYNTWCDVYGNIMSLKDGLDSDFNPSEDFKSSVTITNDYEFYGLFLNNNSIQDASGVVLPATTLTAHCYDEMFYRCENLIAGPEELPATTMADYCYSNMFIGCKSLTKVPSFSATTVAKSCFQNMFSGCSSLTSLPENLLPATTLADYCYNSMFGSCTGLTSLPENLLPSTDLAEGCYNYMFRECKNIQNAPVLPATTMKTRCYYGMFANCDSLTSLPALPATTLAERCYQAMFYGSKFAIEIPKNYLPATTLADSCYDEMFRYCVNVTQVPDLPATVATKWCYEYMYANCQSLVNPPVVALTTAASQCCFYMFGGCSSLVESPVLHIETLDSSCYAYLFKDCSSLTKITCCATDVKNYSRYSWVDGVPASGTFYKSSTVPFVNSTDYTYKNEWHVASKDNSYQGVPSGWNVINIQ